MIFTVGHSILDRQPFWQLLQQAAVDVLMDVRSHPGSSYVPDYGRVAMQQWVPAGCGAAYEWEPDLGGWSDRDVAVAPQFVPYGVDVDVYAHQAFPKSRIAKKIKDGISPRCPQHGGVRRDGLCNCGQRRDPLWQNYGFYDYSFYMSLPSFRNAAQVLAGRGEHQNVAIMCAEALPWRCHRSMIADYLTFIGVPVQHLQPKPGPHPIGNRLDRYEPEILASWALDTRPQGRGR